MAGLLNSPWKFSFPGMEGRRNEASTFQMTHQHVRHQKSYTSITLSITAFGIDCIRDSVLSCSLSVSKQAPGAQGAPVLMRNMWISDPLLPVESQQLRKSWRAIEADHFQQWPLDSPE